MKIKTDSPRAGVVAAAPCSPCLLQKRLVKTVLHRCVDLDWRDADLCAHAGISKGLWSQIRRYEKGLTLKTAGKLAAAVGMRIEYTEANIQSQAPADATPNTVE